MTPLRQRMLDALILRGMALRTQESYIDAVARLARHYKRSPDTLSAEEVQGYLLYLLRDRQRSRSTVNQYGCAFRFPYGTRRASSYLSRRQAASGCLSLLCCTALGTSWRSGFRVTWSMCDQLRVERDQRCGLRWRAWI